MVKMMVVVNIKKRCGSNPIFVKNIKKISGKCSLQEEIKSQLSIERK